ncbi:hypothetical protein BD289DRAFT_440453 [Coniella lustricola]|uniref:Rhodopsin domain-containing protein n=1 Tax=Coniella lustricola TaxID=2025994 RepID=A0A2T3A0N4_9PEZI|nr:hypothetical protein BD289DRAFT_440453 [Coniella lustricola]
MEESRGAFVLAIAWTFTGIAVVIVALRFYTKIRVSRNLAWDDYVVLLSMAAGIGAAILVSISVPLGLGRHTDQVLAEPGGQQRVVKAARIQMIGYPFNILAFTLPNVAIAILVHRLLDPQLWRKRLLWGLATFQVIFAIIPCIIIFAQCSPTGKLWNPALPGRCWHWAILNNITYFLTAYTAMTDVALAGLPIAAFWNLQMQASTKFKLSLMMGLTLLSAIITIVKATYLYLFTDRDDPLWNVIPLVVWGLVEQNVVVIAACVPPVRPLFSRNKRHDSPTHVATHCGELGFKLPSIHQGSSRQLGPNYDSACDAHLDDDIISTRLRDDAASSSSKEAIYTGPSGLDV